MNLTVMATIYRSWPTALLIAAAAFICGCNNDGLASLKATVTVDGQPAPAGINLGFVPIEKGSPSYGTTDENGEFLAAFTFKRMGIEPGEHRVKLMPGGGSGREKMPSADDLGDGERGMPESPKFPQSYFAEITKIKVKPGSNSITIPLETKK